MFTSKNKGARTWCPPNPPLDNAVIHPLTLALYLLQFSQQSTVKFVNSYFNDNAL